MGKISNKVSGGLGEAIREAQAMMNDDTNQESVNDLLNSGVEAKKKRKRRTKAEMEADRQKELESKSEDNSLFEAMGLTEEAEEDNRPEWEKRNANNHDEFCEWELQKTQLKGLPDPDFDYRQTYSKGDIVYYVKVTESLGEKELLKLSLRTIYPRMLIGVLEKGYCQCLGYNDQENIFVNYKDALDCFNAAKVSSKYGNEYDESTGKKKRKRKNVSEEDLEESASDEYLDTLMSKEEQEEE